MLNDLFDDYYQNWKDWAHINSLQYNAKDHTVLISLRNVHAIIKVNWDTMELQWILSNPSFWKDTKMKNKLLLPEGEINWFYQQHAVLTIDEEEEGISKILVYDNHWDNRRHADCFDGDEAYSYVSVFRIEEQKKRVLMEESVRIPKSTIRSNALLYEKYNRLIHMSGNLLKPIEGCNGLIEELNYETKEILNSYLVKPGFFAAYEFSPRADILEKENAFLGNYDIYYERNKELYKIENAFTLEW